MKVETPQILWNAAEGESARRVSKNNHKKGTRVNTSSGNRAVNAALNSVDLLQSGLPEPYNHILVTAGNSSQVNVWNLLLEEANHNTSASSSPVKKPPHIFQRKTLPSSQGNSQNGGLHYRFSLGRQGTVTAVSCCKFSPDGLVLAVACDASNLLLYYVPLNKRGGDNGRHFWASCTKESELGQRMVSTSGEGNTDLSWSAVNGHKRLLVASVDHSVCLVEQTGAEDWQVLYRCSEHTHYVQGVAYDPLGAYLASMSNDRSVRIYPRKANAKTLKKVLKPIKQQQKLLAAAAQQQQQQNAVQSASPEIGSASPISSAASGPLQASAKVNSASGATATTASTAAPPPPPVTPEQAVRNWLADAKFEVGKSRVIRHSRSNNHSQDAVSASSVGGSWKFSDESTLESFFRRLSWTADGQYLICPAGLYHPSQLQTAQQRQLKQHQHAALVFARHNFDEPHKVWTGLKKPAVAVRPNPVLFELPTSSPETASVVVEKENTTQQHAYRNLVCVLTWDSVLLYDTHHKEPLACLSGLHYANLTDAAWSKDGHSLVVCSSDGYVSLIRFAPGELGTPRHSRLQPQQPCPSVQSTADALTQVCKVQDPVIPPTEPGPVQLPTSRPQKKAKVDHVHETTTGAFPITAELPQKRDAAEPNLLVPKKKKKLQPTSVTVPLAANK